MKYILFIAFSLLMSLDGFSQDKKQEMSSEVTTYYFVRHAEKDRSNPKEEDMHLNENGLKRAENWSKILGNIKFDAIYSTNYLRTKETGQPTADKNNLKIKIYEPHSQKDIDDILNETNGKTVLIVGHSNTIPDFVNAVIGQKKYEEIDDKNNGNLYIVTIVDNKIIDQVLTIN